jgi:hypothetical protein
MQGINVCLLLWGNYAFDSTRTPSGCPFHRGCSLKLLTNPGEDQIDITTNGTYPWSFVTQILRNGQLSYGDERKTFEVRTTTTTITTTTTTTTKQKLQKKT